MLRLARSMPLLAAGAVSLTSPRYAATQAQAKRRVGGGALTSMENKVVLITGAGSGIGEACAYRFGEQKAKLVLCGRRTDKLVELQHALHEEYGPSLKIHVQQLDVRDDKQVASLPTLLPEEFRNVSVLVNNAGLALGVTSVDQNSVVDALTVVDTNVMGVIRMCTAFLPGMIERGEGHVINIGSIAGHIAYSGGSTYNASKYAVNGFTQAARFDLIGTPLRMTHISPGMVSGTEFSLTRLGGDEKKAAAVYDNIEALSPFDVADNVVYAATRPRNVQIAEIVMFATNQAGPKDVARVGISLGAPDKKKQ